MGCDFYGLFCFKNDFRSIGEMIELNWKFYCYWLTPNKEIFTVINWVELSSENAY